MQINLFTCNAERNRVNKSAYLSNRFVLDGALRDSTSAMNISIRVEKSNPVIYHYNYMYIAEFDRYYFIDDISSIRTDLWEISATVDVLMSFKDDILLTNCILDKVENEAVAEVTAGFAFDRVFPPLPPPLQGRGEQRRHLDAM